jgi:hypothetical protein
LVSVPSRSKKIVAILAVSVLIPASLFDLNEAADQGNAQPSYAEIGIADVVYRLKARYWPGVSVKSRYHRPSHGIHR